jgi:ACT domain-containing protein
VTAIANDTPGALSRMCNAFSSYGVNLTYLRTHFENLKKGDRVKYRIELSINADHHYIFEKAKADLEIMGIHLEEADPITVPWFPRTEKDIDLIGQVLLEVNESKDHVQFQDEEYLKRRNFIATVAKQYKMGQKIPDVDYQPE